MDVIEERNEKSRINVAKLDKYEIKSMVVDYITHMEED